MIYFLRSKLSMQTSVKGVVAPSSDPNEMLISRLAEHEGIKRFAYKDTKGYITVGIGRCLEDKIGKGLSIDECFYLLKNDIADFTKQLQPYAWFVKQDQTRQHVLVELAFNMGVPNLLKFVNMIEALSRNAYSEAVKHLMDSLWAKQIGKARSDDISYRLLTGRYK